MHHRTVVEQGDAVRQGERFFLVVGHEHGGDPDLALDLLELHLHLPAQPLVQRPEGLVEQQHPGARDERTGQRDALLLSAGELRGPAALQTLELHQREHLPHPVAGLRLRHPAHRETEGHVLRHRHVGEERVVLEHHADASPMRRGAPHVLAVHPDLAPVRGHEAGDGAQQGGLPAPARTEEGEELAVPDAQIHRIEGGDLAVVLADRDELDDAHRPPLRASPPKR